MWKQKTMFGHAKKKWIPLKNGARSPVVDLRHEPQIMIGQWKLPAFSPEKN